MKLTETFHFDKAKYRDKISDRINYPDQRLAEEIFSKRSKRLSAKVRVGVGVAAAIPSHGGSLIAAAYSGRNISVETQKLKLLKKEWENRGYKRLAKRSLKDKVLPIAITAATAGLAAGLDTVFATVAPPEQLFPIDNSFVAHAYFSAVEANVALAGDKVIQIYNLREGRRGEGKDYEKN